jgi:hypothetical protein
MLFPAIGLTTAGWLLMSPLFGLESGVRAGVGIAVGVAAAVLLPIGFFDRRANVATAALGIFMGFANFFLPAPTPALASFATCALMLMLGGLGPWPVVVGTFKAAMPVPAPVVARDTQQAGDTDVRAAA